jgi:hypothetical protein
MRFFGFRCFTWLEEDLRDLALFSAQEKEMIDVAWGLASERDTTPFATRAWQPAVLSVACV